MERHGGVQSTKFCTSADDLIRLLLKLQGIGRTNFDKTIVTFRIELLSLF